MFLLNSFPEIVTAILVGLISTLVSTFIAISHSNPQNIKEISEILLSVIKQFAVVVSIIVVPTTVISIIISMDSSDNTVTNIVIIGAFVISVILFNSIYKEYSLKEQKIRICNIIWQRINQDKITLFNNEDPIFSKEQFQERFIDGYSTVYHEEPSQRLLNHHWCHIPYGALRNMINKLSVKEWKQFAKIIEGGEQQEISIFFHEHIVDFKSAFEASANTIIPNRRLTIDYRLATTYYNIGEVYAQKENWDTAVEYYQRVESIFREIGDKEKLGYISVPY